MTSDGAAAEHQPSCLGVYRMAGSSDGKPVYKQDDGQNYLYYKNDTKSWLVGPNFGTNYAWIKNEVGKSDGESNSSTSSSSASSSSASSSESEHELDAIEGDRKLRSKRFKSKSKKRTPDLLKAGWKYKQMALELAPLDDDSDDATLWMTDDTTLRVEALKGG